MLNKALLVGNLTKDPVFSKTQSGVSVAKFTLACNRTFSKNNEADFITCIAWRQTADFMSQYVKKGNTVAIDGRITTGSYDDQTTGKKVYTTDVTCDSVQLIVGSKREQEQPSDQPQTWQSKAKEEKQESMSYEDYETGEEKTININSDDLPF